MRPARRKTSSVVSKAGRVISTCGVQREGAGPDGFAYRRDHGAHAVVLDLLGRRSLQVDVVALALR
jgi:hypothetical protein